MKTRKRSRRSAKWVLRSPLLARLAKTFSHPLGKIGLALFLITAVSGLLVFNHFYWKYSKLIDAKLAGGPFDRTSRILAAPEPVYVGEQVTAEEIIAVLRNAGYSESRHNQIGHYRVKTGAVEVYPGALSYFIQEPAVIYFQDDRVVRIVSLNDNTPQTVYELEPELITNLFDRDRSKRRLVHYEDYPPVLVNAVISIEDHRFFDHSGMDVIRTIKAAWDGLQSWRRPRGTSTLTQQLARQFFLTLAPTPSRKMAELMIALQLESRLTKQQIFEYYANQVPLGRRGSFNVMGLGEAARAYFDKDIHDVTLAEASLLAGMIQRPSYLNPYRHPERAKARRNTVLRAMEREGFVTAQEYQAAAQQPVDLAQGHIEYSSAPYFVDLVNRRLLERFGEEELITQDYWVYTTLDMNLQRAAVEAVRVAMAEVDEKIRGQRRFRGKEPPTVQCALVALDTSTGEVKAIVGGRNYGESQLNRVLAKRQPGSIFKPFVYATAIATALDEGVQEPMTTISMVDDVPTTFWWDEKPYEPSNFGNQIHGLTTLRYALIHSINIATVKVAEQVGFERVADLAKRAGIGADIQPTPAMALGAYEVTPLNMAGAYTIFANQGKKMNPYFIRQVRDPQGRALMRNWPQEEQVLDPRVAYVITHMLEDVLNHGTAVRARAKYGFKEPAAGKTGTDDDGWFAGYTSKLLCVVWVGFDDNTDIKLEGAHSALPVWTEFMMRAHQLRPYRNPEPFEPVEGIVTVELDPETYELCTSDCPERTTEVFLAGSQPTRYARRHRDGNDLLLATNVAGWDPANPQSTTAESPDQQQAPDSPPDQVSGKPGAPRVIKVPAEDDPAAAQTQKKKGIFSRILDIFK